MASFFIIRRDSGNPPGIMRTTIQIASKNYLILPLYMFCSCDCCISMIILRRRFFPHFFLNVGLEPHSNKCYPNHRMRYREYGGGGYAPPKPPVDTSLRLPACIRTQRSPKKEQLDPPRRTSDGSEYDHTHIKHTPVLRSYPYRTRTPLR